MPPPAPDRDLRAARLAARRGACRLDLARRPRARPSEPGAACGGALRRLTCSGQPWVAREDARADVVPGQYVPVGYARYASPVIDPAGYAFYQIAGARVAVPRTADGCTVAELLRRFYSFGPASVGYVPVGDTYVPAILSPGDRNSLAGADPSR